MYGHVLQPFQVLGYVSECGSVADPDRAAVLIALSDTHISMSPNHSSVFTLAAHNFQNPRLRKNVRRPFPRSIKTPLDREEEYLLEVWVVGDDRRMEHLSDAVVA